MSKFSWYRNTFCVMVGVALGSVGYLAIVRPPKSAEQPPPFVTDNLIGTVTNAPSRPYHWSDGQCWKLIAGHRLNGHLDGVPDKERIRAGLLKPSPPTPTPEPSPPQYEWKDGACWKIGAYKVSKENCNLDANGFLRTDGSKPHFILPQYHWQDGCCYETPEFKRTSDYVAYEGGTWEVLGNCGAPCCGGAISGTSVHPDLCKPGTEGVEKP